MYYYYYYYEIVCREKYATRVSEKERKKKTRERLEKQSYQLLVVTILILI